MLERPMLRVGLIATAVAGVPACGEHTAEPPRDPSTISTPDPITTTLDAAALSKEDAAHADRAVGLMDAGQLREAEALWKELLDRRPNQETIVHELALTYRLQGRPREAVRLLAPYEPNLPEFLAAGYASALDEAGETSAARDALARALGRFPESGLLHSELGTVLLGAGNTGEALATYEKGIEVDPKWPSNYLWAAQIYAQTETEALALIYGETFRLLEPGSERSAKIAALLAEMYRKGVIIQSREPLEAKVSLAGDPVDPEKGLPLSHMYELAMGLPLIQAHADGFSLASLHHARVRFLEVWWEDENRAQQAHPLFVWQKRLLDAGHFEAYDYWLLGPAFPDEAEPWVETHEAAMAAMNGFASELAFP